MFKLGLMVFTVYSYSQFLDSTAKVICYQQKSLVKSSRQPTSGEKIFKWKCEKLNENTERDEIIEKKKEEQRRDEELTK